MKFFVFLLSVFAGFLLCGCRSLESDAVVSRMSYYDSAEHVICENGAISLEGIAVPLFFDDFKEDRGNWEITADGSLNASYGRRSGNSGLVVSRNGAGEAGMLELKSKPFPVKSGTYFVFTLKVQGTVFPDRNSDEASAAMNRIEWLDRDSGLAGYTPLTVKVSREYPAVSVCTGDIPKNATAAVICLGIGGADFRIRDYLCVSSLGLESRRDSGPLWPSGSFVSRPFLAPVTGAVTWQAAAPSGSSVSLQISTAPDNGGIPGVWTPFYGPGHDVRKAFLTSGEELPTLQEGHQWMRYRAVLTAGNGKSPVLYQVNLGCIRDSGWAGQDNVPPVIAMESPALTAKTSAPAVFSLMDNNQVDWRTVEVKLDGADVTARIKRDNGRIIYAPAEPFKALQAEAPNLHKFTVSASDTAGNRISREFYLLVDEDSGGNEVTVREDGFMLLNGKPFFPIGLYDVWKVESNSQSFDNVFRELRKNGFNLAHTNRGGRDSEITEFMDAAERSGIKLFLASGSGVNSLDKGQFAENAGAERHHPALFSWYLAENTGTYVSPEDLKELSGTLRGLDPLHPACHADIVNDFGETSYAAYADSADIFMPKLFPIYQRSSGVPCVVQAMKNIREDMKAAGAKGKSVWPVIQCFEEKGTWRYPLFEELRAMSYLAIIGGGNGIIWYTCSGSGAKRGAVDSPEIWSELCRVSRELASLKEVFLSGNSGDIPAPYILSGPEKDSFGNDSINWMYRIAGKRRFLICANSGSRQVIAEFDVKDTDIVDVKFENRTIKAEDDYFQDVFAPYDVHVYELRQMFE